MHDLGAGAIRVGGPDPTNDDAEESGRTTITDNRIHDCAKVYLGAPAIWIGQSSGNRVAHNEITGGCEWAVSVGWTWSYMPPNNARDNIVEYNHCHHIGDSVLGNARSPVLPRRSAGHRGSPQPHPRRHRRRQRHRAGQCLRGNRRRKQRCPSCGLRRPAVQFQRPGKHRAEQHRRAGRQGRW